ncbi:MAG: amidohydrolase family protein [Deltaproteobacteria bacterium]|nr:amidohydrolase family protein [Deltaproteobacteria bacterium]
MKKSLVIDVHHHWMPEEHYRRPELYVRPDEEVIHEPDRFRIRRAGVQLFSPPKMTARIDEQIKAMDRAGVDRAVLHVGVWLDWADLRAARVINDRMAEVAAQYPDRIIPLAHVPPLDPEGQRELRRAVVDLGFKGVGINTHINGILLDDERLFPFYKIVSDLEVPIVVHPASELPLAHPHGMEQFNLTRNLGRAFDTTINIARLMLSGTLDRFPKLRFVFAHMGGAFFALKNRLNPSFWDRRAKGFFDKYKRRIFVDTAPPFWSPEEIRFAVHMMGEGQVVMGSDFPTIGLLANSVRIIQKAETTARIKKKVLGENARRLFG